MDRLQPIISRKKRQQESSTGCMLSDYKSSMNYWFNAVEQIAETLDIVRMGNETLDLLHVF